MRRIVGVTITVVVAFAVATALWLQSDSASGQSHKVAVKLPVPTTTKTYTMVSAGFERFYEVIAPAKGLLPASAPIIVFLSGIGATLPQEIARDDLMPYVTSDQAELVYPVGDGSSWNAIGCCGKAQADNINDVAFLEALVPAVDPQHKRPIYLVGFSNGGRLGYTVACQDPGLFDAYAMVKGEPEPGCAIGHPVSILQIASLDDPNVPYKPGEHGALESMPTTTLVDELRATEKCPSKSVTFHSGQMTLNTWSGCSGHTRIALAAWTTGQHLFPRPPIATPSAAQVIWSFLTKTRFAPLPKT